MNSIIEWKVLENPQDLWSNKLTEEGEILLCFEGMFVLALVEYEGGSAEYKCDPYCRNEVVIKYTYFASREANIIHKYDHEELSKISHWAKIPRMPQEIIDFWDKYDQEIEDAFLDKEEMMED